MFVEKGLNEPKSKCSEKSEAGSAEDVNIGRCMQELGVTAGDSRDSLGRGRFFPFIPEMHINSNPAASQDFWYWKYIYYPIKDVSNKNYLPNTICQILFTKYYLVNIIW